MNEAARLAQVIADLKDELDNHAEMADDHRKLVKAEIAELIAELEALK